jgi:2-amino-4-hydroxy-6-hydroxymethyldihydropteridine diphosphokinase
MKSARTAIALGSNLGDSRAILDAALETLAQTSGITLESRSSWYQTVPVGPPQPDYINGCALLRVNFGAHELLAIMLEIEDKFGRQRRERWGARTLDLDLLLFEDLIVDTPALQLPHPRLRERAFVLMPLAEIAPDWSEPAGGETIRTLLEAVDCSGVRRLCG